MRGPYRVLEFKHSLSHTHPNRGAGANSFILIISFFNSLVRVINRPKKGHDSPNMGYSIHKAHLRPKLREKGAEPPIPTHVGD